METLTLSSDRLSLTLAAPGTRYLGSRFDWTTQVFELILDGRWPLLTQEKEAEPSPAHQGWGLAGEFGIETAIGFDGCPVGGWFPKVGVGLLRRPDGDPYRFNRSYEVQPARFAVRSEGRGAVQVSADQSSDRGYGWFLKRHWSVRGAELTLTTTLANTGSLPLATEEYIHNFLGTGQPVGPGWVLSGPGTWNPGKFAALVDPEALLAFEGPRLTWKSTPTRDFFFSDQGQPVPTRWTLAAGDPGPSVTEEVDFAPSQLNVWGRGHVVSPELYHRIEVAPGATLAWTRRWTFGQEAGHGH